MGRIWGGFGEIIKDKSGGNLVFTRSHREPRRGRAVSYTHLDVYKRQVQEVTAVPSPWSPWIVNQRSFPVGNPGTVILPPVTDCTWLYMRTSLSTLTSTLTWGVSAASNARDGLIPGGRTPDTFITKEGPPI